MQSKGDIPVVGRANNFVRAIYAIRLAEPTAWQSTQVLHAAGWSPEKRGFALAVSSATAGDSTFVIDRARKTLAAA
jgi:hypothetical protein